MDCTNITLKARRIKVNRNIKKLRKKFTFVTTLVLPKIRNEERHKNKKVYARKLNIVCAIKIDDANAINMLRKQK